MRNITITYRFKFQDNRQEIIDLVIDGRSLVLSKETISDKMPEWAALDFHQCPHCPLKPDTRAYCPLMVHLVHIVKRFESRSSYDPVHIEVQTEERRFLKTNNCPERTGISDRGHYSHKRLSAHRLF